MCKCKFAPKLVKKASLNFELPFVNPICYQQFSNKSPFMKKAVPGNRGSLWVIFSSKSLKFDPQDNACLNLPKVNNIIMKVMATLGSPFSHRIFEVS